MVKLDTENILDTYVPPITKFLSSDLPGVITYDDLYTYMMDGFGDYIHVAKIYTIDGVAYNVSSINTEFNSQFGCLWFIMHLSASKAINEQEFASLNNQDKII